MVKEVVFLKDYSSKKEGDTMTIKNNIHLYEHLVKLGIVKDAISDTLKTKKETIKTKKTK